MHDSTTPRDLRIMIADLWSPQPLYLLAAKIGVHPANLSGILRGRLPLRAEVAERIKKALQTANEGGDGR